MEKRHAVLPNNDIQNITQQFHNVGYPDITTELIEHVVLEGIMDVYSQVIAWLSNQIKNVYELECVINPIIDAEDVESFTLEVNSFLKEICCSISLLMEGPLKSRFLPPNIKLLLMDYLITELQTARICASQEREKQPSAMSIQIPESYVAKDLKVLLTSLGFQKPPPTITSLQVFGKTEERILEYNKDKGKSLELANALFLGTLTEKQWYQLSKLQEEMQKEYRLRREMLLCRLDVTVESFYWSDRLKDKACTVKTLYCSHRSTMDSEPDVNVSKLLSADKGILQMEATSTGTVREKTKSELNKVLIGEVPDRGGRTDELQAPPPEIPSWQQNSNNHGDSSYRGGSSNRGFSHGKYNSHGDTFRGSGDGRNYSHRSQNSRGVSSTESSYKTFNSSVSVYSQAAVNSGVIGTVGTIYAEPAALSQGYYMNKASCQNPYNAGHPNLGNSNFGFSQQGMGIGGYSHAGGDFQRFDSVQQQSDNQKISTGGVRNDGRHWQERGRGQGGRRGGRRW